MCYKIQIVSNVDVCVGEGESCEGDKTCCNNLKCERIVKKGVDWLAFCFNLKCERIVKKGVDCDSAIAFDMAMNGMAMDEWSHLVTCASESTANFCKKLVNKTQDMIGDKTDYVE